MAAIDTAMTAIHLLFAGLWAGATVFVSLGVLPAARDGTISRDGLGSVAGRFAITSRASALLLLLSGGYAAGEEYTAASLVGTTAGRLVIAMVVLWLVLAGLSEVGASRLGAGRADAAGRLFAAASVVAVALLLVGGVLAA